MIDAVSAREVALPRPTAGAAYPTSTNTHIKIAAITDNRPLPTSLRLLRHELSRPLWVRKLWAVRPLLQRLK